MTPKILENEKELELNHKYLNPPHTRRNNTRKFYSIKRDKEKLRNFFFINSQTEDDNHGHTRSQLRYGNLPNTKCKIWKSNLPSNSTMSKHKPEWNHLKINWLWTHFRLSCSSRYFAIWSQSSGCAHWDRTGLCEVQLPKTQNAIIVLRT